MAEGCGSAIILAPAKRRRAGASLGGTFSFGTAGKSSLTLLLGKPSLTLLLGKSSLTLLLGKSSLTLLSGKSSLTLLLGGHEAGSDDVIAEAFAVAPLGLVGGEE